MTRASIHRPSLDRPGAAGRVSLPARAEADTSFQEYEERIEQVPATATTRGMFFLDLLRRAPRVATTRPRYIPFTSYPLREFMQLLLGACKSTYPSLSPHEALRSLGHSAYSAFATSLAGTALFGITDHEYLRILELAPRGYKLSLQPADVELGTKSEGSAVAHLRQGWSFPESYHLGLWEGGMDALKVSGKIDAIVKGPGAVDLHLTWDPGSVKRARGDESRLKPR